MPGVNETIVYHEERITKLEHDMEKMARALEVITELLRKKA
jgi:hypothetical protein